MSPGRRKVVALIGVFLGWSLMAVAYDKPQWYFEAIGIIGILVVVGSLSWWAAVTLGHARSDVRLKAPKIVGQSWLSYLLLWPLIFDADKGKREGRFLTTREWIGWGLVVLIAVLAVILVPSRRGG